jgi:hypothetical protein
LRSTVGSVVVGTAVLASLVVAVRLRGTIITLGVGLELTSAIVVVVDELPGMLKERDE